LGQYQPFTVYGASGCFRPEGDAETEHLGFRFAPIGMGEKCRFPIHRLTLFEAINEPLEPFHEVRIGRVFPSLSDECVEFAPYGRDRSSYEIVRGIKRNYTTMNQHANRFELHYDPHGSRFILRIVFVELFSRYT